jgi:hypothetical protein
LISRLGKSGINMVARMRIHWQASNSKIGGFDFGVIHQFGASA